MSGYPELAPWRATGFTEGSGAGEVFLRRNGTQLDVWLMVGDRPVMIAVPVEPVRELVDPEWAHGEARIVHADSRGLVPCPHCGSTDVDRGGTALDMCRACGGMSRNGVPLVAASAGGVTGFAPVSDQPGTRVNGYCPMGCGQTLEVVWVGPETDSRRIECVAEDCEEPHAVDIILADPETEHVVTLVEGGYSVKHPLRERLDDELMHCQLSNHVAEFGPQYLEGGVFGEPIPPDVPHRVWWEGEGEDATVQWERLE